MPLPRVPRLVTAHSERRRAGVASSGQRQADHRAVVALDPGDERAAQAVDGERAGHLQRLAGGHVGVDLGVGDVGEVDGGRPRSPRPACRWPTSIRQWPVCSTPCRPRIRRQRSTASAASAGLPRISPSNASTESQPSTSAGRPAEPAPRPPRP